jgi:hypothetical protein
MQVISRVKGLTMADEAVLSNKTRIVAGAAGDVIESAIANFDEYISLSIMSGAIQLGISIASVILMLRTSTSPLQTTRSPAIIGVGAPVG